jgi:hypothetical protein
VQGPAARRARWPVREGRVLDQPRGRHRHLPSRADRSAAAGQGRAHRPLRPSVPGMPARRAVHHLTSSPVDPRRRLRAAAHPRPRAADRPGVEGRLHGDPPESGAEDRSPDATPTRRPPRPRSRAHQSRCRLLTVGCRGEPRQARDTQCHPPHQRMGREHRVTPEGRATPPLTGPQRPPRPDTPGQSGPAQPPNARHPANGHHREPPTGRPTAHLTARRTAIYTSLLEALLRRAGSPRRGVLACSA